MMKSILFFLVGLIVPHKFVLGWCNRNHKGNIRSLWLSCLGDCFLRIRGGETSKFLLIHFRFLARELNENDKARGIEVRNKNF